MADWFSILVYEGGSYDFDYGPQAKIDGFELFFDTKQCLYNMEKIMNKLGNY